MGFGPMGFGVAGVMGPLAAPDRPAVSVCGDGAFFMHANVLGTAVEYNIPVVWLVWNNYAYGSIRGLQRGYLGGRELATDFHHPDTGKPYNPDFAAWHGQLALKLSVLTGLAILAMPYKQALPAAGLILLMPISVVI